MSTIGKIKASILVVLTAAVTIAATAILMNVMAIKPMRIFYEAQARKQNELILELAKIQKYSIQNTYTIKKPKKGSTVILAPDNDIQVQEITQGLDKRIMEVERDLQEETTQEPEAEETKGFWGKITRLFNTKKENHGIK